MLRASAGQRNTEAAAATRLIFGAATSGWRLSGNTLVHPLPPLAVGTHPSTSAGLAESFAGSAKLMGWGEDVAFDPTFVIAAAAVLPSSAPAVTRVRQTMLGTPTEWFS